MGNTKASFRTEYALRLIDSRIAFVKFVGLPDKITDQPTPCRGVP